MRLIAGIDPKALFPNNFWPGGHLTPPRSETLSTIHSPGARSAAGSECTQIGEGMGMYRKQTIAAANAASVLPAGAREPIWVDSEPAQRNRGGLW
jgi:hypothetical protein